MSNQHAHLFIFRKSFFLFCFVFSVVVAASASRFVVVVVVRVRSYGCHISHDSWNRNLLKMASDNPLACRFDRSQLHAGLAMFNFSFCHFYLYFLFFFARFWPVSSLCFSFATAFSSAFSFLLFIFSLDEKKNKKKKT